MINRCGSMHPLEAQKSILSKRQDLNLSQMFLFPIAENLSLHQKYKRGLMLLLWGFLWSGLFKNAPGSVLNRGLLPAVVWQTNLLDKEIHRLLEEFWLRTMAKCKTIEGLILKQLIFWKNILISIILFPLVILWVGLFRSLDSCGRILYLTRWWTFSVKKLRTCLVEVWILVIWLPWQEIVV